MRNHLVVLSAILAQLFGGAAIAEVSETDETALSLCVDAAVGDLGMKDCYAELASKEDARLNLNWLHLIRAVGGPKTEIGSDLREEQRAWLAYKELACRHYLVPGTTMERLMSQTCFTNIITQRADELEQLAAFYDDTLLTPSNRNSKDLK